MSQEDDPFTKAVKKRLETQFLEEAIRIAESQNHPAEMDAILADPAVPKRTKHILLRLWGFFTGNDDEDDENI